MSLIRRFRDHILARELSGKSIKLSIGTFPLYALNNGMVERVTKRLTPVKATERMHAFMLLIEQEIIPLSSRQWKLLRSEDAQIIRKCIEKVLDNAGIPYIQESDVQTTQNENQQLNDQYARAKEIVRRNQ